MSHVTLHFDGMLETLSFFFMSYLEGGGFGAFCQFDLMHIFVGCWPSKKKIVKDFLIRFV